MKYCHKCKTDYLVDIDKCPDCGGKLRNAPGLEETVTSGEKEWVVVTHSKDQHEAEAIRGLLESEGITASVRDPAGVLKNLYGPFPFFRGTVEIYVHESNLVRAREIILDHHKWTEEELTEYMETSGELDIELDNGPLIDLAEEDQG